jgi:hypothetical protein
MRNVANERMVWKLRGNVAELSCGQISGRIDVWRPNAGLHHVTMDAEKLATDLLRVYRGDGKNDKSWPSLVAESYVRGQDFVAIYQPSNDWPFSPQVYWRANSLCGVHGVLASISLLVSVQTHLLDTVPQIAVSSQVPCDEISFVSLSGGGEPRAVPIESSQTSPSTIFTRFA